MDTKWYDMSKEIRNIPITRWVASWYIGGGTHSRTQVYRWLESIIVDGEKLTDEEIEILADCVMIGKFELEQNVRMFLAQ